MPKRLFEESIDQLIDHVTAVLQRHKVMPLAVHLQQRPQGSSLKNKQTEVIAIQPLKVGRSREYLQR